MFLAEALRTGPQAALPDSRDVMGDVCPTYYQLFNLLGSAVST